MSSRRPATAHPGPSSPQVGLGLSTNQERWPELKDCVAMGPETPLKHCNALPSSAHPLTNALLPAVPPAVELGSRERMVAFCESVQRCCPIGSYIRPVPGKPAQSSCTAECTASVGAGTWLCAGALE